MSANLPGHNVINVFTINRALKFTRLRPAILREEASVNNLKNSRIGDFFAKKKSSSLKNTQIYESKSY